MVVAKIFAKTLSCVEREATVKTESESNAALNSSQEVETLNEVEAVALVYTQDDTFLQVQA